MFDNTFLVEMFQSFLKGTASGIGSVIIQPTAKFVLNLFASKFRVADTKRKGVKIYKAYKNDKEISETVCEWVTLTICKTFQENGKETVRNLLKFISIPDKFKEYLINYFISYLEAYTIFGCELTCRIQKRCKGL